MTLLVLTFWLTSWNQDPEIIPQCLSVLDRCSRGVKYTTHNQQFLVIIMVFHLKNKRNRRAGHLQLIYRCTCVSWPMPTIYFLLLFYCGISFCQFWVGVEFEASVQLRVIDRVWRQHCLVSKCCVTLLKIKKNKNFLRSFHNHHDQTGSTFWCLQEDGKDLYKIRAERNRRKWRNQGLNLRRQCLASPPA